MWIIFDKNLMLKCIFAKFKRNLRKIENFTSSQDILNIY